MNDFFLSFNEQDFTMNHHQTFVTVFNQYHKIPKYSDTRKIAVIILKFEQDGFTVE